MRRHAQQLCLGLFLSLVACRVALVFAEQLPSLFRGVVVADSPLGVRVVGIEAASQAAEADLRPEDIIVRVNDFEIHTIDEFAVLSNTLKGRAVTSEILVFRNGEPKTIHLHLYSYPVLRTWGIEFVPDHDIRFAEASVGLAYWVRLGRGFEEAHKTPEALNAYLNGLHNLPTDTDTALKAAELFSRVSQEQLDHRELAQGIASLRQALLMLEKLFDRPLADTQLRTIRRDLQDVLQSLHRLTVHPPHLIRSRLAIQTLV